ncbi:MAG TPA: hypothetical protein PLG07_07375, partial [Phenylobacterium sp.]|nr:hypothetical protein [Phenylobacterium sp.]
MRSLAAPPHFVLSARARGLVTLHEADGPAAVHLAVLEEDLIRVVVLPRGGFDLSRTWAIAPGETDVADNGRDRLAVGKISAVDLA